MAEVIPDVWAEEFEKFVRAGREFGIAPSATEFQDFVQAIALDYSPGRAWQAAVDPGAKRTLGNLIYSKLAFRPWFRQWVDSCRDEITDAKRERIADLFSKERMALKLASLAEQAEDQELPDKAAAIWKTVAQMQGHLGAKVEVTGKDGGPIETKDLSDKEIARRLAFLLAAGARETD